jgi:Lrp/AsnC family leucine-responsive transcriptional regulator
MPADGGAPLSGLQAVAHPFPADPVELDEVDRRLIALLAADARASQRSLARHLNMSPPAVGERIARLERAGVIQGYTVRVGWSALGYVTAYLAVTATQGADQAALIRSLHALPEVEEVLVITGSMDLLIRVRVRDHNHLRNLLLSQVWQIEGLQRTETFVELATMPDKEGYVAGLLDLVPRPVPGSRSAR